MQRLTISLKSFLCLLCDKLFVDDLVQIDYLKELASNQGMRNADDKHKSEFLLRLRGDTLERRRLLLRKLGLSFLWIFLACLSGLVVLRLMPGMSIGINKGFGVLSLLSFSWATLGRLGWEGQTIGGGTVFEKLDSDIFWFLYFMGTMFGVVSILAN